jgi:hypothetical protein
VIDLLNPGTVRKPLAVRWSKKSRGFFVENLFTVDCEELDDLLAVLEEGKLLLEVSSSTSFTPHHMCWLCSCESVTVASFVPTVKVD